MQKKRGKYFKNQNLCYFGGEVHKNVRNISKEISYNFKRVELWT